MPVYNPTQLVSGSYVGNDHLNPIVSPTAGAYTIEDGVTWYYNGSTWFSVTRPQFTQGGTSLLYFTSVPNGVGFETLSNTPDLSAIDLETISLPTAGVREYLNHEYKADIVIGVTEIPAGQWGFKAFASADLAGHGTTLQFEVGTTDGTTTTWHFTVDSPVLVSSEVSEYDFVTVQPTISCAADDYIVVRASAISETNNSSVTWVHSSPTAYSCFSPPQIPTLHDDLSGLNAGDVRHLTLVKEAALDGLIANGGGGGGTSSETVIFVTDSAVNPGQPVVLKSGGHVGAITGSSHSLQATDKGIITSVNSWHQAQTSTGIAEDPVSGKMLMLNISGASALKWRTGVVSDNNVVWGTDTALSVSSVLEVAVAYEAIRQCFVIIYTDNVDTKYIIATISGSVVTFSSPTYLMSAKRCLAVAYGNGKLLFAGATAATSGANSLYVLSLSTSLVLSVLSTKPVETGDSWVCSLAYNSKEDWFGRAWQNWSNDYAKFYKVTVGADNTVTVGAGIYIAPEGAAHVALDYAPYANAFFCITGFYSAPNSYTANYRKISITDGVPSVGTAYTFTSNTGVNFINFAIAFSTLTTQFVAVYQKATEGYYALCTVDGAVSNYTDYIGISQSTAATNATVSVRVNGVDSLQSGLTPGTLYYLQSGGGISATVSSTSLGKALTSTKLLMKPAT